MALNQRLDAFFKKYTKLHQSTEYAAILRAKTALRSALLPELKHDTIENVAKKYGITDSELLKRMQWSWKT